MSAACAAPEPPLAALAERLDFSYLRDLRADPEEEQHRPNTSPREVFSGHYVRVAPTPLRAPHLLAVSRELADALGVAPSECASEAFLKVFSGDLAGAPAGFQPRGWATPYALSIYGEEMEPNGAGPHGYGYGDGRAISIAEVQLPPGGGEAAPAARLELQLKGGGRTPFCRGADGAAVLRSSVREFLASEAMHALGVPTTRALSLIVSREEVVVRPWYSNSTSAHGGGGGGARHGGDVMLRNLRAITTRAAPSFLRVGQFELYGRRARRGEAEGLRDLELLARHALAREYPALVPPPGAPLQPALLAMLREASARFAALAAHWLRVGYVQSNFNSDNCLVGGATMDYGPFGFLEAYDPAWAMWIGSGAHFAFANQPAAAARNFGTLARALAPLLDAPGRAEAAAVLEAHAGVSARAVAATWARKLGFAEGGGAAREAAAAGAWDALERLLRAQPTDFTIAFRQLAAALEAGGGDGEAAALAALAPALRAPLAPAAAEAWRGWLRGWRAALAAAGEAPAAAAARMRAANPKWVPREWMLIEAYEAAEAGDAAPLLALHELFKRPYDEQPGAPARFYRWAPEGSEAVGGLGFMSCSS
jgi:uncharacterized protein YdiU (UPF0061 family)